MIFYQSLEKTLPYPEFIEAINQRDWIDKAYHAYDYSDFVVNLVKSLILGEDIQLVDYRNVSESESTNRVDVSTHSILSVEELIHLISHSDSEIGIYSSGTTGIPKLIYQSVARLMKSVRIDTQYERSRWGFTYNPSHSAGIQMLLQVLCNKGTLHDLYKCSRSEIIDTMQRETLTHLSATPTFYRMLAPYDFELPSLKSITFNGEKSSKELIKNIKSIAPTARIRNIYGSTESGPLMSSESTIFEVPARLNGLVKIENDELLLAPELVSQSVTRSRDWYHTGDLVEVLEEHPLVIEFITRKTSILNVGGQNVSPQEVEEVLISYPAVKDASVSGKPHKMIGNLIVAQVQLFENQSASEKDLIDHCKSRLAQYKVPRIIKFLDRMVVGRTGKKVGAKTLYP